MCFSEFFKTTVQFNKCSEYSHRIEQTTKMFPLLLRYGCQFMALLCLFTYVSVGGA